MIEPLHDLPAGVLGFRVADTLEASDYREVLDPAIDAALAAHRRLDLVVVMDEEFDHLSLGGMWEDAQLLRVPRDAWGRAAFVTDHEALAKLATTFGGLVPGEFKVFPLAQQGDAVAWVAAGAKGAAPSP